MDREECWRVIAAERLSLAEQLDGLSDAQWDTPSLCDGWRVRDVVSHLVLGANPPSWPTRISWTLRKAGRFNPLNRDLAIHFAAAPPSRLTAQLREHAKSQRLPVPLVTNHLTTLLDVLVHGQDIAVPLGLRRPVPVDAAAVAATKAWTMAWPFWAKRRLRGLQLMATDVDWSVGSGVPVEAPIAAVLFALTGRPAAAAQLSGEGADDLGARLAR